MNQLKVLSFSANDELYQKIVSNAFSSLYSFTLVGSELDFFSAMNAETFDAIILDLDLGRSFINDIKFINKIKTHTSTTPMILVTNNSTYHNITPALMAGVSDYIIKSKLLTLELTIRLPRCIEQIKPNRVLSSHTGVNYPSSVNEISQEHFKTSVSKFKQNYLNRTLTICGFQVKLIAERFNLQPKAVYKILKKHCIEIKEPNGALR